MQTGRMNWSALIIVFAGAVLLVIAWEGTQNKLWGAITGVLPGSNNQPTNQPNNPPMTVSQAVQGIANALGFGNKQYATTAAQDAINAGIDPTLFLKQINQESGFNPKAQSPAGAEGIAQFMPGTAQQLNINPWDPTQALQGSANLMESYFTEYGSYQKSLAAYNAGEWSVNNAIRQCGGNWLSCLPQETQKYVRTITGT